MLTGGQEIWTDAEEYVFIEGCKGSLLGREISSKRERTVTTIGIASWLVRLWDIALANPCNDVSERTGGIL